MKNIKERLKQCFENLGIVLDDDVDNFKLSEYLTDSITFVSFLVEIEQEFDIQIPDEYLSADHLNTYMDVENLINLLLEKA